ncbi:GlsB/YeaQ/YmgE family stress response membrane protein [Rarobacter faecitabidus]|uniref:Putative membrane protein YeaQ/YmgE (Transglycosylase-associated protein family) n=1 Tax=Rarobacter faecitabidus TaxID=13243 RepID=A0A542ZV23_RARFA|nr:GlsB/YeaQ/YmgE family stress response membrane protein [Rarobacter faecitabidus]TQL64192.1 putative membrane protein YeaQ/YmgE (transglycosylase-associated protein family) [Rarobacter faecitabidus]
MGLLAYALVGIICGSLAKAILKDRAVGGWVASLVIGMIGAVVGGWLGVLLFDIGLGDLGDIRTWLLSLAGSIVVLLIYTSLTGKRARA